MIFHFGCKPRASCLVGNEIPKFDMADFEQTKSPKSKLASWNITQRREAAISEAENNEAKQRKRVENKKREVFRARSAQKQCWYHGASNGVGC